MHARRAKPLCETRLMSSKCRKEGLVLNTFDPVVVPCVETRHVEAETFASPFRRTELSYGDFEGKGCGLKEPVLRVINIRLRLPRRLPRRGFLCYLSSQDFIKTRFNTQNCVAF